MIKMLLASQISYNKISYLSEYPVFMCGRKTNEFHASEFKVCSDNV